jgi:hypothetical protein
LHRAAHVAVQVGQVLWFKFVICTVMKSGVQTTGENCPFYLGEVQFSPEGILKGLHPFHVTNTVPTLAPYASAVMFISSNLSI